MVLDELAKYIQDHSIGTVGVDIFKSYQPSPDKNTTTLYEYGGTVPQFTFATTAAVWENPRIQVVNRSTDYQKARNKAELVYRLFSNVVNQTIKQTTSSVGSFYLRITPLQSPYYVTIEKHETMVVACNYQVMKTLST